jgi:hypothetical protein
MIRFYLGAAIIGVLVVGAVAHAPALAGTRAAFDDGTALRDLEPATIDRPTTVAQATTEAAETPEAEAAPAEDATADAIEALQKMGDELMSLQEIAIRVDATLEQVMDSGQKIEFGGTVIYRIRRPDRLRADIETDTGSSSWYYDGKTLTLWTPSKGFYGRADAKPTIRETIEWAEDTYGLEVPLADLFDWGTERAPIEEIREAFLVGLARIDGVECAHFAFRTDEVDWEIWIEAGDRPLPRKFSVTDRTQEDLPRFEAHLKWSTWERFDDSIFSFDPPANAKSIPLAPLSELARLPKPE